MSTINVAYDECYAGTGSKYITKVYNGASVIMSVGSNVSDLDRNAIVENLVIDGTHVPGTTGLLLADVCNCVVRNVTIMNCDVGIEVKITAGNDKASGNRFEHIRMINVKKGILFTGTPSGKNFSHTIIDDVGISLAIDKKLFASNSNYGIHVGVNAKLHNAYIKATVWTSIDEDEVNPVSVDHVGLVVDGELKYSLVNLEVEYAGTGVRIGLGGLVSDNQSFLLTTLGLVSANSVVPFTNEITVVH